MLESPALGLRSRHGDFPQPWCATSRLIARGFPRYGWADGRKVPASSNARDIFGRSGHGDSVSLCRNIPKSAALQESRQLRPADGPFSIDIGAFQRERRRYRRQGVGLGQSLRGGFPERRVVLHQSQAPYARDSFRWGPGKAPSLRPGKESNARTHHPGIRASLLDTDRRHGHDRLGGSSSASDPGVALP